MRRVDGRRAVGGRKVGDFVEYEKMEWGMGKFGRLVKSGPTRYCFQRSALRCIHHFTCLKVERALRQGRKKYITNVAEKGV
jgi:hypothetical protein